MAKEDLETFCPESLSDWRNWLAQHHQTKQSVWLIFYKKSSKHPSISWSEAMDEALCFGWIDSTKRTIDKQRYMQYFSKRKAKSLWSAVNKAKVRKLIQEKRMSQAGFESIEIAKENGSWNSADQLEALVVPDQLEQALVVEKEAKEFFDSLSKSNKKLLLHWVMAAKRAETKAKRIAEIVEAAKQQQLPKQFRRE